MLKLVRLEERYMPLLVDMMDEWKQTGEKIIPGILKNGDYHVFEKFSASLDIKEGNPKGYVPSSTFFCLDTQRGLMVGAVSIRHYLNESLLQTGGHIGDGVRPSERRKGIATRMIGLALEECRKMGISKVLMTCDKDNIGSAKSIMNNGGVLENEVAEEDGNIIQRYWITLE